jgi:simple sugar transport system permease protein
MKNNIVWTKATKSEHFSLYVTLVLVYLLMGLLNGPRFFTFRNLTAMMYQMPMIGLLAIGMLIAELTGGINLSLVSLANFNGVLVYELLSLFTQKNVSGAHGGQVALALVLSCILCLFVGFLNGALTAFLHIPALLVTLGTMTLLQGINLVMTKGYTLSGFPDNLTFFGTGTVGGIPMSLILFAVIVFVTHIILNRTVYGKQLYMTGANPIAARYSNVNTTMVVIIEYILSALFSFFASIVMIGQMNSVKANYYESYVLIAVLASFLGGVNPNGGFGKIGGTVIAAIILQVINTGLNLLRLDPFMVTAMWGAIIILVSFGREFMTKIRNAMIKKTIAN